jgi:hypothetical protein
MTAECSPFRRCCTGENNRDIVIVHLLAFPRLVSVRNARNCQHGQSALFARKVGNFEECESQG